MNRAKRLRKILFVVSCAIALFALAPGAVAVGGDEIEAEPQASAFSNPTAATAVAGSPTEGVAADQGSVLHAQVVRGLPFSNFDLLALCTVLLGLTAISYSVHRLNRDPGEQPRKSQITTDAG